MADNIFRDAPRRPRFASPTWLSIYVRKRPLHLTGAAAFGSFPLVWWGVRARFPPDCRIPNNGAVFSARQS